MSGMKVFIATPAYDGKVVVPFENSLKQTMVKLRANEIDVDFEAFCGCCYLPLARNYLVKKFLDSDATDMVFVDADMEWEPEAMFQLLSWPVDMVAGAYRTKEYEERYPVWIKTDSEHRPVMGGLSGLVEAWQVATGFFRITRSAFLAMQRHYGESLELDEYDFTGNEKTGGLLNFFDTGKVGRIWLGEDTQFCRRWTMEMGRQLWIDPTIRLVHWGSWPSGHPRQFAGDYHDYLSRLPGGSGDPGYQGNDIPGYLMKKEAQWLYERAKQMDSVVEIGSFAGRSAHALMSACAGPVTCVDPWEAMDWRDVSLGVGVADDQAKADYRFERFLAETGKFPNRKVLRTTSVQASEQFDDKSVDMVWIDGDHSAENVERDILSWLPKCRKLICGHDYEEWGWPAVKKVVDRVFTPGTVQFVYGTSIWYVDLGA